MDAQFSTQSVLTDPKTMFPKEMLQPLTYSPAFDLDFVERLLGRRQRSELPRTTGRRLSIQQNRLREVISPRLIWKELSITRIDKTGVTLSCGTHLQSRKMAYALQNSLGLIGFIATVGRRIDREIESLMDAGALAHGYVADALGSGAVESLADRFHNEMARKVAQQEQKVGLRFSPGYCDWPLTDQHKLFSILDHEAIGVELGDTALMTPRKSITAVFGVFAHENDSPINSSYNPCRRCGKKDCIARRVEEVPPLR